MRGVVRTTDSIFNDGDSIQPAFTPAGHLKVTNTGGAEGGVANPPYTDATGAASGTMVALLKGVYVQNAQIITLLTAIRDNTATG